MVNYRFKLILALMLMLPARTFGQGTFTKVRTYTTSAQLAAVNCNPNQGGIAFVFNDANAALDGMWQCTVTNTWVQVGTGGGGGGAVTGDLSGTVPGSISVVGLRGSPVSAVAPSSSNQFLNWSGAAWQAAQPSFSQISGTVASGQLPSLSGIGTCGAGTVVGAVNPFAAPTCVATGAGTVTSVTFTGDGTVLSNTPSAAVTTSGTLNAALASAGAHKLLGNFTGAPATPTYGSIATADLPFTYSGNTTKLGTTTGTLTNGNCVSIDADGNFVDFGGACGGGGGGGTVTSVGLAAPTGFGVSGSPVLASGTLTFSMPASWVAGDLLVGSGANSVARLGIGSLGQCLSVVAGPALGWGACGGVASINSLTGALTVAAGTTGTDVNIAVAASTITVNIPIVSVANTGKVTPALKAGWDAKAGTGTCGANQFASATTTGGVTCGAAVTASSAPANQFARGISAAGALTYAQPTFGNIAGVASVPQGGTGAGTLPASTVLQGNGTSPVSGAPITTTPTSVTVGVPTTINGNLIVNGTGPNPCFIFGSGGGSPSICGGTGAPLNPCTTGSLWCRFDGGAGTTLYVCENSAWVGK